VFPNKAYGQKDYTTQYESAPISKPIALSSAIVLLETGGTSRDMVDDVVKIRERRASADNRIDCVGTRTADARSVRVVNPKGLTDHFDEPFFGTAGRKAMRMFVAHYSGSSEWPAPFVPLPCSLVCALFRS
jgi:hypothetical protein